MITWENKEEWLEKLPCRSQVMFGLFCALQVRELWEVNDDYVKSIKTVERWLEGEATVEECRNASCIAHGTSMWGPHGYAINAAANAVYAAYAAAYPDSGRYVHHYANAAANAIDKFGESIKQEQVEYLRELYLETLPEEHRNNWLVQACL